MKPNITNSNPFGKLEEARLREFESYLGAPLPCEYRQFLIEHNGGLPDPCCYWIEHEVDRSDIEDSFFGLNNHPFYDLQGQYEYYKSALPPELLPIAHDGTGNVICISCLGETTGSIFFWDHEKASHGDQRSRHGVTKLADSFNEFLSGLIESEYD